MRVIEHKLDQVDIDVRERIAVRLQRAQQVLAQRPKDKRQLDALHMPEEAKTLTRRQWRWIKRR
ncbi:IS1478 transposase [Xanthomonas fragariae]|nr:IS1478 transposase [Xanthomonas fragariae]